MLGAFLFWVHNTLHNNPFLSGQTAHDFRELLQHHTLFCMIDLKHWTVYGNLNNI